MKSKQNKWKIAFFSLVSFIVLLLVLIFLLVRNFLPNVEEESFISREPIEKEASFLIQTDKDKLNQLIASRIEQAPSEVPYMVELMEEDVQFRSTFSILGQNIPVTINFNPEVEQNGDLLLSVQSFTLGFLQLPVDRVLMIMNEYLSLEDWIEILPSEEAVIIRVTDIQINEKDTMFVRFQTFDLENDVIELEMILE
ncbi:YpmS family protein [Bacillus suaedae]|uniref:YpmS family protein n=1 Tax=Halalkalibacter suaedae TaxID=2822140 RepID=A0A940WW63_9BACI|nr:YpmS family protein [Bacillus suaedae]MBP3951453.1 YpmS family protein [Bacillus suaedae]